MKWYCHIKGQQYGPVDDATLRNWIAECRIMQTDLIWAEGMENWVPASSFNALTGGYSTIEGTGGITLCKDIRKKAREMLSGKWGICAIYMLGFAVIIMIGSILTTFPPIFLKDHPNDPDIAWGQLIFSGPFTLGFAMFFLGIARGRQPSFGTFFAGFKHFMGAFGLYWCMLIFILLWSLLFIIPGILASLSYSMAYYVYADNPELGVLGSIKRSKEMMYGHRWKFFVLNLTFIGWALLSLCTCYIGFLWYIPYLQTSLAIFYHDIQQPQMSFVAPDVPQSSNPVNEPVQDAAPMDLSRPQNPQQ